MAVETIRNVPDEVKDALACKARESGKSLQAYLLDVLNSRPASAATATCC